MVWADKNNKKKNGVRLSGELGGLAHQPGHPERQGRDELVAA
jgi:hypothetical protein